MREGMVFDGPASAMLSVSSVLPRHMEGRAYEVSSVFVPVDHRREGNGSNLIRTICASADMDGVMLILMVSPLNDGGGVMDSGQLERWYGRFGFRKIQDDPVLMARMVGGI